MANCYLVLQSTTGLNGGTECVPMSVAPLLLDLETSPAIMLTLHLQALMPTSDVTKLSCLNDVRSPL